MNDPGNNGHAIDPEALMAVRSKLFDDANVACKAVFFGLEEQAIALIVQGVPPKQLDIKIGIDIQVKRKSLIEVPTLVPPDDIRGGKR